MFVWVCAPNKHPRLHPVCLPKTQRQSSARHTYAVRHRQTRHGNPTLWTYQVWSSSKRWYRGGGGRGDTGELDKGGMRRTGDAPVCLLWTALFLPRAELWQAVPAVWIRHPALPWPWEEGRHAKPGEGARGLKGGERGAGVGGLEKRAWADWRLKISTRARWSHSVTVRNWWKSSGGTLGYTRPLETHPTDTSRAPQPLLPTSRFEDDGHRFNLWY